MLNDKIEREKALNRSRCIKFRVNNPERSKELKANWRMKNAYLEKQ